MFFRIINGNDAARKKKPLALNSLLRYSCKAKCRETVVNFGGVKVEENIQEKKNQIKENTELCT